MVCANVCDSQQNIRGNFICQTKKKEKGNYANNNFRHAQSFTIQHDVQAKIVIFISLMHLFDWPYMGKMNNPNENYLQNVVKSGLSWSSNLQVAFKMQPNTKFSEFIHCC